MRAIVRAIDAISKFFGGIAAVTVVALVVLMLYDVVLRYVFNSPTLWGYDVNTMLMGASFVLAIAYALSHDAHVRVDLLYGEGPRPRLAMVDLIGLTFVILPTIAWLAWGLWNYFYQSYLSGELSGSSAWNPPLWPLRLIFFIGFLILMLQVFAEILKRIMALSGSPYESHADPADHA